MNALQPFSLQTSGGESLGNVSIVTLHQLNTLASHNSSYIPTIQRTTCHTSGWDQ